MITESSEESKRRIHCSQFLIHSKTQILQKWNKRLAEEGLVGDSTPVLTVHLPQLLDQLALALVPSPALESSTCEALGASPLSEVIRQYHLLRPILIEVLGIKGPDDLDSVAIVNRFIDARVESAVAAYPQPLSEERDSKVLRGFFMQSPIPMMVTEGPEHRYLFANPSHDAFLGVSVTGKTVEDVCSLEESQFFVPILDKVYRTGEPWVGRELPFNRMTRKNPEGAYFIDVNFFPYRDSTGAIKGVLGFVVNVTEQVESRSKLKEEEERFRQLADGLTNQVLHIMDLLPHRVTYVSPSFEKIMGINPKELEQDPFAFLKRVHPEDRERVVHALRLLDDGIESEVEYRLLLEDGTVRWISDRSSPLLDKEGRAYRSTGIAEDITEQKLFEHKLQDSEAKFRTIANAMPQMVWSTLPDGHHDYYNQRWYEFTGMPEGTIDDEAWNDMFHPDDREKAWELWEYSLKTGEPYQIEYRLKHRSGRYRWTLGRALPVRDENGEIIRWMGTCTDIQDIRETAQALSNAVKARDEFLSIASHELKTPLTSLKLQTQLVQRDADKGDKSVYTPERVNRMLAQTDQQVQRLTRLIDDMLDISRMRSGNFTIEKERFDLSELVKDTTERLAPHFTATGYRVPEIEADPGCFGEWDKLRIEQVLINLLTNSIRYGDGKPIAVKVENLGEGVRISVRDHGIGIAKADQKKIFNRFERAVDANEVSGLGLGLYITRMIVKAHGGRIWVESKLGVGSTFFVDLPLLLP